jgi:hypothetical protein
LDDLLHDVKAKAGVYETVNEKIRLAVCKGLEVLEEYTAKMDDNLIYYIASILDPRIKTDWLREHLGSQAEAVIDNIRTQLKIDYPTPLSNPPSTPSTPLGLSSSSRGFRVSQSQQRMHERVQRNHYGEAAVVDEIDEYSVQAS